ncbi:calcium-binding protein [Halorussus amylolyticus]|uniref:calcium-binding protein n=1 Tax=Halorussus amylolyticus TaxID=1126242 RepID=UPI001042A419|nr:calcium-binding protein [Halorussus amylolyticus]
MKKGVLASGALALGLGASGTATAQQASSALVFTYDFATNRRFEQTAQLQQGTTNGILQDVVSQPDEWTGFIGRYREDEEDPGEFFITFTRGGPLGTGVFGADVTFFATDANLLMASIQEYEGSNGG